MRFTEKEQKRLDEIARKIADILWDTYPEMKGRYTWESAHESALELVIRFNHPSTAWRAYEFARAGATDMAGVSREDSPGGGRCG